MRNAIRIGMALVLLAVVLSAVPAAPADAQGSPVVLAYFYGWFNSGQWGDGQLIDRPAEPYDSADGGVMARQVSQARSAGIDGFVMSWFGPDEPYTTGVFHGLLDQAAGQGFMAGVDVDMGQGFLPTTDAALHTMSYAINTLANHPAYLRYGGKPVFFFWKQDRFSVAQWAEIRRQVDPDHNTIWIAEGNSLPYLGVFDGLNLYNIAWSANPASTNALWAQRTRQAGGYFVGTAMPGFDESRLGRGNPVVRGRGNGDYFRRSFAGAAAAQPHMIIITSWNEFFENSHIEPSQQYGTMYLDMAREMIAGYKSGAGVPPAPDAPAASPLPEGVVGIQPTVARLNVRQGPSTNDAQIGQLSQGSAHPVLGKNGDASWLLVDYGDGQQGWVAGWLVRVVGGTLDGVPVVE